MVISMVPMVVKLETTISNNVCINITDLVALKEVAMT